MVPPEALEYPTKQLKVELLPAPLTPRREKTSPLLTPNEVPLTALKPTTAASALFAAAS